MSDNLFSVDGIDINSPSFIDYLDISDIYDESIEDIFNIMDSEFEIKYRKWINTLIFILKLIPPQLKSVRF